MGHVYTYALDLSSPVGHLATELGRVAPAALSVSEMAKTYKHPIPSDFTRIVSYEDVQKGHETEWLISTAVGELGKQVKSKRQWWVHARGGGREAAIPAQADCSRC